MKGYQTEQKRWLLAFLQKNQSRLLTVEQIAQGLAQEHPVGKSTVYRLMNQLVETGEVGRMVRGNSRQFVYQLMDQGCGQHLHCRCVTCGRLYHLDSSVSRDMGQMLKKTGFALDPAKTTLLGTCDGCGGQ